MRKMRILFGFDIPQFEEAVKKLLLTEGVEAEIAARQSKESVRNYVMANTDCEAVVLMEATKGQKPYTAEEVALLTDSRDINVIIVLTEKHIGTEYMKTLYTAGVLNAVFQKGGKNGGAYPSTIASLLLQGRKRAAARDYYGLSATKIDLGYVIDNSDYANLYEEFKNEDGGLSGLENYINICSRLSVKQIYDFTKRLPKDDREYLTQFEEFHTIATLLARFGFDLKIKRPKKVFVGLNQPVGINAMDDRIVIKKKAAEKDQVETQKQVPEKKKGLFGRGKKSVKKENRHEEKGSVTEPVVSHEDTASEFMDKQQSVKPSTVESPIQAEPIASTVNDFLGDIPDEVFKAQLQEKKDEIKKEPENEKQSVSKTEDVNRELKDPVEVSQAFPEPVTVTGGFADLYKSMRSGKVHAESVTEKIDPQAGETISFFTSEDKPKAEPDISDKEEGPKQDDFIAVADTSQGTDEEVQPSEEMPVTEEEERTVLEDQLEDIDDVTEEKPVDVNISSKIVEQGAVTPDMDGKREPVIEEESYEEDEQEDPQVFFEYDPSYDDLVIRSGIKDRIVAPVIVICIIVVLLVVGWFYWRVTYGSRMDLF